MEPGDVVTMSVDLVGLDQVREHQTVIKPVQQLARLRERHRICGAGVLLVDPDPGEQLSDLADRVDRHPARLDLLQVAAGRRRERVVAATVGPLERSRRPGERPGDHTSDGVGAAEPVADPPADLVQLVRRDHVHVRGDLGAPSPGSCRRSARARSGPPRRSARSPRSRCTAGCRGPRGRSSLRTRSITSAGKPFGYVGGGAGITTPISSQWPAVESFPGPSGWSLPCSTGAETGGTPTIGMIEPSPRRSSVGRRSPPAASERWPSVFVPASP